MWYSLSVCSWGMTLATAYLRQPMRRFLKGKYFLQKKNLFLGSFSYFRCVCTPYFHWSTVNLSYILEHRPFCKVRDLLRISSSRKSPTQWFSLFWRGHDTTWPYWGAHSHGDEGKCCGQTATAFYHRYHRYLKKKVNQLLLKSDYI